MRLSATSTGKSGGSTTDSEISEFPGAVGDETQAGSDGIFDMNVVVIRFDGVRFKARYIQNVVDDIDEVTATVANLLRIFLVLWRPDWTERLCGHQLRKSNDGVERRFQFVIHIGEEFDLCAVGNLRFFLCQPNFCGGLGKRHDIRFERLCPVVEYVADTDHPTHGAVDDHGQMTDAMTRHRGKRIGDLRLRRAGYKVGAHQVAGVKRKRYFALFGNAAHDVAFGNDSDQIAAGIGDHNRANNPIGQNDCDVADCGGGQDGNDFAALEVEGILVHMNFLPLCVNRHAVPDNLA